MSCKCKCRFDERRKFNSDQWWNNNKCWYDCKKTHVCEKDFFLFIQKHIYNGHINKMKKSKTKIHITVIRCKATITPEIKLKEEQLQN